ncbi:MAG: hypothetical protein QM817_38370 [Archangium sp.]
MSLKPVVLGFCIGLLVAITPACGAKQCSTATCSTGCCDAKGDCQQGNSASACGQLGGACAICQLGTACNLGVCMTAGTGGGTAGGQGGGTTGGGTTGGGTGGGATGGGTGGGVTGGGTGGGVTGGGTGGGAGCDGCLFNGSCITRANSNNDTLCGQNGVTCATCSGTFHCQNYVCVNGGTGGGTTGGGGGTTGGGTGGGVTGAGTGGGATGGGTGGGSGVTVGSLCTSSAQCSSLGAGATCKLQTNPYSGNAPTPYPAGFCTLPCTGTGTCPSGATCAGGVSSVPYIFNEVDRFCTKSCTGPGQCIGGLECLYVEPLTGTNPGAGCWMSSASGRTFTGGGLPSKAGNPCTTDSQCQNPPDPILGQCITSTDFANGYCLISTSPESSGAWCQSGGRSKINYPLSDGGTTYYCTGTCPTVGQLAPGGRTGYTCYGNMNGTGNVVWPSCATNADCGGSVPSCNATTGFCCTDTTYANCANTW